MTTDDGFRDDESRDDGFQDDESRDDGFQDDESRDDGFQDDGFQDDEFQDDDSRVGPSAARVRVLEDYRDLIETTFDCADAVAAGFETTVDGQPATRDARAIRGRLRTALDRAGAIDVYPAMLADAVAAAGGSTPAPPVAAPPYVAVSSTGPVLRATTGDSRLVVRIDVFAVRDGVFVRTSRAPEQAVRVEIKE